METAPAMTVQFHPGRLTGADLETLSLIAERCARDWPRFAAWTLAVVAGERERRRAGEDEDETPIEPELPALAGRDWPTPELARACEASFISFQVASVDDASPGAAALMLRAHKTLLAMTVARVQTDSAHKE